MSSIIDPNLLSHFSYIFTFLLVFVISFAILELKKILGENRGIHAIIALALAFLVTASTNAVVVITSAAPWFVIMFFFIFLILLGFTLFGYEQKNFFEFLKAEENRYIGVIIVIVSLVIIGFALAGVWGQKLLQRSTPAEEQTSPTINETTGTMVVPEGSTATPSFQTNLYNTIFHPKVLGLAAVLLVAVFAIKYLAKE